MAETIKVLIVDDEYHARKLLSEYVGKLSFLELAGMASNVFEAMNIMQKKEIDLLLLDIQMPEITGLQFVRSLRHMPYIIFTTAYSEYAVESYELDVIDYLLKPIAFPRFLQAITKVTDRKEVFHPETVTTLVPSEPKEAEPEEDSILIKSGYKLYKILYDDLLYVEGQREYVTFHTSKQKIMTLFSLKDLEEKLPADRFVRIHKSYIVSVKCVELVEKNSLQLAGKILPIGNNYKENFMKLFERS